MRTKFPGLNPSGFGEELFGARYVQGLEMQYACSGEHWIYRYS